MLQSLKINNFLLFKNQEIVFDHSFTVITGETGSGKSMFIKALRFVLGEKIDILDIDENNEVLITAKFKVNKNNSNLSEILAAHDIELEDGDLILRRSIGQNNKNKIFVNDVSITLKLLKRICDELVEFHSQHKQLEAFNHSNCLNIIDQFIKKDDLLEQVHSLYQQITKLNLEIDEKYKEKEYLESEREFIEHSFKEINALHLKKDEELELIEKKKLFQDKVKIISAIGSVLDALKSDDIVAGLIKAQRNLSKIDYDTELYEPIESVICHLNDLQALAENKLKNFDFNDSIDDIEERLSKIKELCRKYHCNANELVAIAEREKEKLDNLNNINQVIIEKERVRDQSLKEYFTVAQALSNERKVAAKELQQKILNELKQLKLEQVEFYIDIASDILRPIHSKGIDQAKFLIKTNKGFSFAEISDIASGGELSRIMLAFKVALAENNQKNTIIFDEIDSGTGGAVAQTIGNRLRKLSQYNQIIAISHQPQVASKSSQHLLVQKSIDKVSEAKIIILDHDSKIQEIARMLSGINITESARKAALSLIEEAIEQP